LKNSQNFVGIDLGGESGRVVLGSFDGQRIELQEKHRFATGGHNANGSLRWDVNKFWEEMQRGLAIAAQDTPAITSVGVDTWGVDYALLDAEENLIDLPFHYRDSRNVGTLNQIFQTVPKAEVFDRTGIQFMEINTLCQLFASQQTDDILSRSKHLLTIADYFHWCLCGSKSIEFTFATTTQCFDPVKRDWAKPMLEKLGIPTHMLPEVVEPGTNLGSLRSSVASATGLESVSVVAPATHDTGSAIVAVPVDKSTGENWAYISSGTWSLVGMEVPNPVISSEALAANVTNEGGVDGTWRLLKNVMGLWLIQRLRLAFSERGFDRSYAELTKMAGTAVSPGCFIDPDDPMFLNPPNMEQAILRFCEKTGQVAPEDEAAMVRCVLESLALRYTQVLREVESLAGAKIDVIHVVGGGCQNILLNQFISGATRLPVLAGPSEATALGNVLIQCQSAGGIDTLSDIREVVRNSVDLIKFEPTALTHWHDALGKFETIGRSTNDPS
jgi:rhamnulokinase